MLYINALNRPLIPALPTYNSDKNTDNAALRLTLYNGSLKPLLLTSGPPCPFPRVLPS